MLAPMLPTIRWDVHARGCVRQFNAPSTGESRHCRHSPALSRHVRREECYRRFAESGYHYGPTFQGIERLWRGEREILAEIHVPSSLSDTLSDYRLHPASS